MMTDGGSASRAERDRLRAHFEPGAVRRNHDPEDPGNRWLFRDRWDAILRTLRSLRDRNGPLRYIEIGSGYGEGLREVAHQNVTRDPIVGLDLVVESLRLSRTVCPGARVVWADGAALPFRDRSFDVVAQFLMLSSVLDGTQRRHVAKESMRVLRSGGWVVCLDPRYPQLRPSSRVALTLAELRTLYPGAEISSTTLGLVPPLARVAAPLSVGLCRWLSHLSPLRVYRLAVIRKPG